MPKARANRLSRIVQLSTEQRRRLLRPVSRDANRVDAVVNAQTNSLFSSQDSIGEECTTREHVDDSLQRSLAHPHPEATELADMGIDDWSVSLPADDEGLIDENAGTPVRWLEGHGWIENVGSTRIGVEA